MDYKGGGGKGDDFYQSKGGKGDDFYQRSKGGGGKGDDFSVKGMGKKSSGKKGEKGLSSPYNKNNTNNMCPMYNHVDLKNIERETVDVSGKNGKQKETIWLSRERPFTSPGTHHYGGGGSSHVGQIPKLLLGKNRDRYGFLY